MQLPLENRRFWADAGPKTKTIFVLCLALRTARHLRTAVAHHSWGASLAFNSWAVSHSGAPKGIGTLPVGFLALASEVMTEAGNEVRGKTHTG